jgi:hypothetical protein
MRVSALLVAIGITACVLTTAAPAAEPPTQPAAPQQAAPRWTNNVRLDSAESLERLRTSNPLHYAIARKILAAATEICDAQKGAAVRAKFEAQDVRCASAFWYTSNPPKRALSFRIDDTVYSVLVEVRDLGVKLNPADPAWGMPLGEGPRK